MSVATVAFHDHAPTLDSLTAEAVAGLSARPRRIAPKFFYDETGSKLFDAICRQPEYYPTRTEEAILEGALTEIARRVGRNAEILEFGSGVSRKIRLLLEALRPGLYAGIDISGDFLRQSTERLALDYPWLEVHAICADFTRPLTIPSLGTDRRRIGFFPGSSIGNFEPQAAGVFLKRLHTLLGPGGALLIGVDLVKSRVRLDAAYNDAAGYTARFNRNLLVRLQREAGAVLDVDAFDHHAFFNEAASRIEMHLVSRERQSLVIDGHSFHFAPGESIHTENSYKYTAAGFQALAEAAGFRAAGLWTDPEELFSVHYLELRD